MQRDTDEEGRVMMSFVDDYEFGAHVVRVAATQQGKPDPSALCAVYPDVTEQIGATIRPGLVEFAATVNNMWRSLPWHVRARIWIVNRIARITR